MALKCRFIPELALRHFFFGASSCRFHVSATAGVDNKAVAEDGEFRVLELGGGRKFQSRSRKVYKEPPILPPRYKRQKIDQDWGSVWPAGRSFHPATVPFPVRQGYPAKGKPTPDKWGNAELMKVPNFLHLTPPVIERQCEAIKKFCTPWPAGLESVEKQEKHFPITTTVSSYLHSSPTIRDSKARIVTLQVSLKSLDLDEHGRDKLLRLVGEQYDPSTNILTLTADRCPLSQQNMDYCRYLLTVLYNECMKIEPWEHEKQLQDRECYVWEGSPSQASLAVLEAARGKPFTPELVEDYKDSITAIHNDGEDEYTISKYRDAVMNILGQSQELQKEEKSEN